MHEDRNGNLWFGAPAGLTRIDSSGKSHVIAWRDSPHPNQLHTRGCAGIAVVRGRDRPAPVRPENRSLHDYTTRDGLPDNVVQCILPDQAGNLWLSTNRGISRFDPRDGSFANFHESDGLQGEQFNRKACFADSSGMLYFGGCMASTRSTPADSRQTSGSGTRHPDRVADSRKHVPVRAGSVLPKPLWEMEALNLSHRDEDFHSSLPR